MLVEVAQRDMLVECTIRVRMQCRQSFMERGVRRRRRCDIVDAHVVYLLLCRHNFLKERKRVKNLETSFCYERTNVIKPLNKST